MGKWFATTFGEIRLLEPKGFQDRVVGQLSEAFSFRAITEEQRQAWRATAKALHGWASPLRGCDRWLALLEYAPPLITARSDLVIVANEHVLVLELKTGHSGAPQHARRQVLGYADDLYWFHPGCRGVRMVPVVVATSGESTFSIRSELDERPKSSWVLHLTADSVPALLAEVVQQEANQKPRQNDPVWSQAQYSPRPHIVDVAVALVAGNEDAGLSAALADDQELERLLKVLGRQVDEAAQAKDHRLLLVTGAPGSGKTLVGLRLAHDPKVVGRLRGLGSEPPLYLTGNGPLVAVLKEALARDFHRRNRMPMVESRKRASVLIKLVHAFTRDGLAGAELNVPHVAVFDEGQRVWDSERMGNKHKIETDPPSEPTVILERLKKKDWAVVVVLVGEGQEINTGEAGAQLWLEAAATAPSGRWHVLAPSHLAAGVPQVTNADDLRLVHCRRSEGAAWLAEWVDAVLHNKPDEARNLTSGASAYPIVLTRDLEEARRWLRQVGMRSRFGLVASARAGRLRAYGLEMDTDFQAKVDWPNWFLDRPPSLEASTALEVAASEFKCQGLELDYVGLAWSWDMVRHRGAWSFRHLKPRQMTWSPVIGERARYGLNAYRVLLTRARAGMAIWVPQGSDDDFTRDRASMDEVAAYLRACGVRELQSVSGHNAAAATSPSPLPG